MLVSSASRTATQRATTAFPAFSTAGSTASIVRSTAGLPRFVIRQRRHSSSNRHSSTPKQQQQQTPVASAPKQEQQQQQQQQQAASQDQQSAKPQNPKKSEGGKQAKNGKNATAQSKDKQAEGHLKSADAIAANVRAQLESMPMPPSVAPTPNVDPKAVQVALLFAQHRPISLNQPVPTSNNMSGFESIFSAPSSKKRTQDVIFTLANTVKALESAAASGTMPSSSSSGGSINLEELSKHFRPFNPPPAPVAFDSKYLKPQQEQQKRPQSPRKQQTKETKLAAVSEEAPLEVEASLQQAPPMPEGAAAEIVEAPSTPAAAHAHAPFRQRMRVRQEQWQLISVKRQRKLKMKKHKFKKLMKRTRNLRRRQDRL